MLSKPGSIAMKRNFGIIWKGHIWRINKAQGNACLPEVLLGLLGETCATIVSSF